MKKTLCVLLTALLLMILTACNNTTDPGDSSESSRSSSSSSSSSSEQSSSGPQVEKKLNEDLLSDIGLTYEQLVEKHGKVVEVGGANGGLYYKFKNGYGQYPWSFGTDINEDNGTLQLDGNEYYVVEIAPKPNPQAQCNYINYVKADDLLLEATLPISLTELEEIEGLTVVGYGDTNETTDGNYWSTFLYEDIKISISTVEKGILEADSYVQVYDSATLQ